VIPSNRFLAFGLFLSTLGVFSCVFDDGKDATSWIKQSGLPTEIGVDTLVFDNVAPLSVSIGHDSIPFKANSVGGLGNAQGVQQELFLQIASIDSAALTWLKGGDSSWASLRLTLDSAFYREFATKFTMPLVDDATMRISWDLVSGITKSNKDSIVAASDSLWLTSLQKVVRGQEQWDTGSVVIPLNLKKRYSSFEFRLPDSLQAALKAAKGYFNLRLRLRLDDSYRIYRIQGPSSGMDGEPLVFFHRISAGDTVASSYTGLGDSTTVWMRMAQAGVVKEQSNHLLLHGGMYESLYVDIPSDLIWQALKAKLGDSLSNLDGHLDSLYVDQLVLMAAIDLPAETATNGSELGLPVPVLAYSYIDSAVALAAGITPGRITETRRVDTTDIKANGRSNLIFYAPRDTVSLQITQGLRHWLETARYGGTGLHAGVRLNWLPLWSPKDYHSADYSEVVNSDTTDVKVYSAYPAYSRWDLGNPDSLRFRLRVWLTEKR